MERSAFGGVTLPLVVMTKPACPRPCQALPREVAHPARGRLMVVGRGGYDVRVPVVLRAGLRLVPAVQKHLQKARPQAVQAEHQVEDPAPIIFAQGAQAAVLLRVRLVVPCLGGLDVVDAEPVPRPAVAREIHAHPSQGIPWLRRDSIVRPKTAQNQHGEAQIAAAHRSTPPTKVNPAGACRPRRPYPAG